jgi:hypothetical protein
MSMRGKQDLQRRGYDHEAHVQVPFRATRAISTKTARSSPLLGGEPGHVHHGAVKGVEGEGGVGDPLPEKDRIIAQAGILGGGTGSRPPALWTGPWSPEKTRSACGWNQPQVPGISRHLVRQTLPVDDDVRRGGRCPGTGGRTRSFRKNRFWGPSPSPVKVFQQAGRSGPGVAALAGGVDGQAGFFLEEAVDGVVRAARPRSRRNRPGKEPWPGTGSCRSTIQGGPRPKAPRGGTLQGHPVGR